MLPALLHSAKKPGPLLSVGVLTHNETHDLERLFTQLLRWLGPTIELVIVDDHSGPETRRLLESFALATPTTIKTRALNRHFSRQRNYLKSCCRGRFILMLDPDEAVPDGFFKNIDAIAAMMDRHGLDLCALPRRNTLIGDDGKLAADYSDFPDYQERLLRNRRGLFWVNHIEEIPVGYRRKYFFPPLPAYSIQHTKRADKPLAAQLPFARIRHRQLGQYRKALLRKFGLIDRISFNLPPPF